MLLMPAISSKIIDKSNHDGGNCAKDDIYEEDELEKDNTAAIISLLCLILTPHLNLHGSFSIFIYIRLSCFDLSINIVRLFLLCLLASCSFSFSFHQFLKKLSKHNKQM